MWRAFFVILFAISGLSSRPLAAAEVAPDARRVQVAAATSNAIDSLRQDVRAAQIAPMLTVGQFVDKTKSDEDFAKVLRAAETIGGARWLDDKTCQVRLELPGGDLADALIAIAAAHPREAGIPADVLRERVDRLRETRFAATGISTCATDRLRPPSGNAAWQAVSEQAAQAAVKDARHDAVAQVIEALHAPPLKLERALADDKVRAALEAWLLSRPVTSADFRDDLEVRVAMAIDRDSLWDAILDATRDRKDITLDSDDKARRIILGKISTSVIGRGVAKSDGIARATTHATVAVPAQPPSWVIEQLDAKGAARGVNGRLKTARAAEDAGREKLRGKIEELSLSRNLTLGNAAKRDPRIRAAIDRTVEHTRPRKVNYLADGGAEVTFTLDLRDLWYALEDR